MPKAKWEIEELKRQIIADVDLGMTGEQVAEKWDVPVAFVRNIAKGHFLRKGGKPWFTLMKRKRTKNSMSALGMDYVKLRLKK